MLSKNSYNKENNAKIINTLNMNNYKSILDLGCGQGNYSILFSKNSNKNTNIYSLDKNSDSLEFLQSQKEFQNGKIKTINHNLEQPLPFIKEKFDFVFISTVFHHLVEDDLDHFILQQLEGLIKENGELGIIEFKRKKSPKGPPFEKRISEKNLTNILENYKFKKIKTTDLDKNLYLTKFKLES